MKATIFVFPHTTLTKIIGKPKHENVTILRKEMYANAMQNDCTLGGGDNGYLGIIMPAVAYADKQTKEGNNNPIAFVKPQPPDPTAAANIIHSTNSSILDFKSMEGQLKGQIMDAIERKYIAELNDEQYGFTNITAKTLLVYIVTKYDVITHHDLTKNRDILEESWDITQPIIDLWARIRTVQQFAKAGNKPIDDETVMHTILGVLEKTGVFTMNITIWENKPVNTWTMQEFQEFFEAANKKRALHTTKEAGYANAVRSGSKSGTTSSANSATTENSNDKTFMVYGDKKIYYCWSHGGNTNANHTSATYNRKKDGHVSTATWENTCGGCTDMLFTAQNKQQRYRNTNNSNRNNNGNTNSGSNYNRNNNRNNSNNVSSNNANHNNGSGNNNSNGTNNSNGSNNNNGSNDISNNDNNN